MYPGQGSGSTYTPDERLAEANRLLDMVKDSSQQERMVLTMDARIFLAKNLNRRPVSVSVKELWWLRDIKDKLL